MKIEQYEVHSERLNDGGAFLSLTKGGMFQAAVGMKTALKVTIRPNDNKSFTAEAGVGIFGMQALPTAGMLLVAWPIIIPQTWGLIKQSKLDDHVLDLIQNAVNKHSISGQSSNEEFIFCSHCGHKINKGMKYCSECGQKI